MSDIIRRRTAPYDPATDLTEEERLSLAEMNTPERKAESKARNAEMQEAAKITDPQERQNAIRAVKAKYGY